MVRIGTNSFPMGVSVKAGSGVLKTGRSIRRHVHQWFNLVTRALGKSKLGSFWWGDSLCESAKLAAAANLSARSASKTQFQKFCCNWSADENSKLYRFADDPFPEF